MKNNTPLERLLSKYFEYFQDLDQEYASSTDFDQEKSLHQIRRKISDKKNQRFSRLLTAACIILVSGFSFYFINNLSKQEFVKITTTTNEVKKINLPDGSKVWLNSKSELRYAENFGEGKTREIALEGEGYFEVKRNEKKPFVITSEGVKTTVLGTAFNVCAYKTDVDVRVGVINGKVAVEEQGAEVILVKNQQAVFDKASQKLAKNNALDVAEEILWKEGKLSFKGVSLDRVVAAVERNFDTEIVIGDKIKNCKISADFTDLPIDKIVKILEEIVNGSSSYKGNKFHLTGNGCT